MEAVFLAKIIGALYGASAILFGAFGAHALKKKLAPETLHSFETGVKYQMYHAILLVVLGYNLKFEKSLNVIIVNLFVFGTLLFSFSIYVLCIVKIKGEKLRFLGPVTPIGGLLLAAGWAILLYSFIMTRL